MLPGMFLITSTTLTIESSFIPTIIYLLGSPTEASSHLESHRDLVCTHNMKPCVFFTWWQKTEIFHLFLSFELKHKQLVLAKIYSRSSLISTRQISVNHCTPTLNQLCTHAHPRDPKRPLFSDFYVNFLYPYY